MARTCAGVAFGYESGVRFAAWLTLSFALLFAAPRVHADSPSESAPVDAVARAKELFRRGVALFDADTELALDLFQRSRAEYPSANNTLDAALCLERLGRPDEALDLYDELLASFEKDLDPRDRAAVGASVARLSPGAGSIEVASEVEGASVIVDGRLRGKLPRRAPFHARAGAHAVRVLKGGRRTFETTVDVKEAATTHVDATLPPLDRAGTLRVEDPGNDGATLFVDRVSIGTTPWEGTLGPGTHAVWTQRGDIGSAPTLVTVVEAQTMIVRLHSARLGPVSTFAVTPTSATIALDGAPLGIGTWEGRLPPGSYTVIASEPGYVAQTKTFTSSLDAGARVTMTLAIDSADTRWEHAGEKVETSAFFTGAFGGGLGVTFGSDKYRGYVTGARAGLRFHGFAVEGVVGYAYGAKSQHDAPSFPAPPFTSGPASAPYDGTHAEWGPFAGVGISYRWNPVWRIGFVPRLTVGAMSRTTAFDGMTVVDGKSTKVVSERSTKTELLGVLELGFDVRVGPFFIGTSSGTSPLDGSQMLLLYLEYVP